MSSAEPASGRNALGQPVGVPVAGDYPRPFPPHVPLIGGYTRLDPLRAEHADTLFDAFAEDADGRGFTYLPYDPFPDRNAARRFFGERQGSADPQFYTIADARGTPSGTCSYLRITPAAGSIEVGWIHLAPHLQGTAAATEAMVLLMRNAFDTLGYRRYEWKCDALNAPSRAAATRLGFTYEGTHRQAAIVKGRNRDTAWYSILDSDWPALRARLDAWLDPGNFDGTGRQKTRLQDIA